MGNPKRTKLNTSLRSLEIDEIHTKLSSMVIGQPDAVDEITKVIEIYKAGLTHPNRPISTILCMGPTGSGKTRVVEALSEILFGNEKAFIKVDCGEFSGSNSPSSFVGAPPGYIGHNSSEPVFTQAKLDKYKTDDWPFSIVLLDEIEKAADNVFQLLLGILDKATLRTNSGETIDFSNSIIFMTSNLGADKISSVTNALGFIQEQQENAKIETAAVRAVEKKFSPEFFNRIDHSIVFKPLTQDSLNKILNIELSKVKKRIFSSNSHNKFTFMVTRKANEFLIREGFNSKYGARQLKRTIEKYITNPLSTLMMTYQVEFGDLAVIACYEDVLAYEKVENSDICNLTDSEWEEYRKQLEIEDVEQIVHALGMVGQAS